MNDIPKKKSDDLIFFGASLFVHILVVPIFLLVNRMMVCHWGNVLYGEKLPNITNCVLFFGYIWPFIFLVLHLCGFILSFKIAIEKLIFYGFFIYTLEIIIIAITVYGYVFPDFTADYRLGVP